MYEGNLFLIGDSLDRMAIKEWCIRKDGSGHAFGESTLKYDSFNTVMGSFICKSGKFVASFVHIFGSSSNGPYLYMDPKKIPILGTSERIEKSLEFLIKEVNIPTRIVLTTVLWDLRPFRTDVLTEIWNETIANTANHIPFLEYRKNYIEKESPQFLLKFEKDMNDRINEIIAHIEYHNSVSTNENHVFTNIGLRTTPYYSDGGTLLRKVNDIIRNISSYRNITLYDLDLDVWSKANFSYTYHDFLFRDLQHPHDLILFQNIDKLMGLQWNLYFYYRNNNTNTRLNRYCDFTYDHSHYHQDHHTIIKILSCLNYTVPAVVDAENNVYLLSYYNSTQLTQLYACGNITVENLLSLYLGHGDMLPIPNRIMQSILLPMGSVPFNDIQKANGHIFISSDQKYFIVDYNAIKVIENKDVAELYTNYRSQHIYTDVTSTCFYSMQLYMRFLPNLYQDGKAYRLSRSVYFRDPDGNLVEVAEYI